MRLLTGRHALTLYFLHVDTFFLTGVKLRLPVWYPIHSYPKPRLP
jgi:hypothetical protein